MGKIDSQVVAKALAELEKDRARVETRLVSFLTRAEKDPISTLGLRFSTAEGFSADPFRFQGEFLSGTVEPLQKLQTIDGEGSWKPESYSVDPVTVEPQGILLTPWGVVTAVTVAHDQQGLRLKLEGWKKPRSRTGPIYMVDPVNHEYLQLIASSLEGEVVAGVPRSGVLIFETPSVPTDRLQIHFSDVELNGEPHAFQFEFQSDGVGASLRKLKEAPAPAERIKEQLRSEVEEVRAAFLSEQSGCTAALVPLLGFLPLLRRWIGS